MTTIMVIIILGIINYKSKEPPTVNLQLFFKCYPPKRTINGLSSLTARFFLR